MRNLKTDKGFKKVINRIFTCTSVLISVCGGVFGCRCMNVYMYGGQRSMFGVFLNDFSILVHGQGLS